MKHVPATAVHSAAVAVAAVETTEKIYAEHITTMRGFMLLAEEWQLKKGRGHASPRRRPF